MSLSQVGPFRLARSCWPRNGVDRGNRSQASVAGPATGDLRWRVRLPKLETGRRSSHGTRSGIAVSEDGTLRVTYCGGLHAVGTDGQLLWSRCAIRPATGRAVVLSSPVALADGHTAVATEEDVLVFDAQGTVSRRIPIRGRPLDDSGFAPNLTRDGRLIVANFTNQISLVGDGSPAQIQLHGYDLNPVAVFDDGTLAAADYYGLGYCRVRLDGALVWKSQLLQADGLPTVARNQFSAVHSLNDGSSAVLDPDGGRRTTIPFPALFAETVDGTWIALGEAAIARFSVEGTLLWEHAHPGTAGYKRGQPVVDAENRIFIRDAGGALCLNEDGSMRFAMKTGEGAPGQLAIAASGALAVVVDDALCLFGA